MALAVHLPPLPAVQTCAENDIFMINSGDLRDSANLTCWPVQQACEQKLAEVFKDQFGYNLRRAMPVEEGRGHGFIASQREGSDICASIPADAPLVVMLAVWQYSHHVAVSLAHHKGPILLIANFDGTWPGLVGLLCLSGSLTSIGVKHSRLWSEKFEDDFFLQKLQEWIDHKAIQHDTSHLKPLSASDAFVQGAAADAGREVAAWSLRHKEIMGLFDTFCMGMINGVFPQKALMDIAMPLEGLSQSALVYEMSLVTDAERDECLRWYEERGMQFQYGSDSATELTRDQVLEQCAMMIAMARFTERFGLTCVGVQYQQGLKDVCAASDFAEGALGSTERFPIRNAQGQVIREGKPIPVINEVDMGTAIPQTLLFRLLDSVGLNAETTLHDIRWGSEYEGTFYWDFEISGAVPFSHIKGGIAGAIGYRQPAMFFPRGGSTIGGQCKAGAFLWARAHYEGTEVHLHIGSGTAVELPQAEFQRRSQATTPQWPLMNAVLHGVDRDQLMAGHQSNHITLAYVPENQLEELLRAFAAQALAHGMKVYLTGSAVAGERH